MGIDLRWKSKLISKIIEACRRFSSGDFSRKIILTNKGEIGELADTINKMAQAIEDKINEAKAQNQKLEAIFNSMIEGVIVVDKVSCIISINPTIERIFSVSKRDAEGRFFLEAIPDNNIAEIIEDVLKRSQELSKEVSLVWPVHKIFKINASPIFEQNSLNGCLLVIHDITELRRLEGVRRDFVANISHELKTPLTSIKGFVETLLEGALEDKENNRAFLRIIQEHTERLDNLVNDLLSLSHLESKEMKLEKEDINIYQHVEKVILGFKSQLKKKNIEIKNELLLDLSIKADRNRIGEVFTNLIDNAIKFNKEQGIIKIYSCDIDGKIKVIVEDSGIGIPEKDKSRIFERFFRVDKARSRGLGGTGLGLSIVKHIIEMHEGSVGVESTEGFGSKFYFLLPSL